MQDNETLSLFDEEISIKEYFSSPNESIAQDCRGEAFRQLQISLPEKKRVVFNAIAQLKKCTCLEVVDFLRLPINQVSSRIKNLKDAGHIKEVDKIFNPLTKRENTIYSVNETLFS